MAAAIPPPGNLTVLLAPADRHAYTPLSAANDLRSRELSVCAKSLLLRQL